MTETIQATVSIRDKLVLDCIKKIAEHTDGNEEVAVHAALVFFVVEEILGLEEIDKLRDDLKESVDRIIRDV